METINERTTGGKHRQVGEDASMERIPTPRRDNRTTDQMPRVHEPRRAESRGQRPARTPETAGGGRTRDGVAMREQGQSGELRPDDDLLDGPADEWFDDDLLDDEFFDEDAVDRSDDEDAVDTDDEASLDANSVHLDSRDPDDVDEEFLADVVAADGRRGRDDEESAMDRAPGSTRTGSVRAVTPAYAPPDPPTRRRRGTPPRRTLRRIGWVAAALAALLGLGLAALVIFPGMRGDAVDESPAPPAAAAPVVVQSAFGEDVARTDGWRVKIEEPQAVRSTDDIGVPDNADRAVRFDVVLTNNGSESMDSAGWTVKATVGTSPVEVLPIGGAPSRTIRPGASLTFPVTVPMPEGTTELQLEAAPPQGTPTLFVGTA